MGNVAYALQTVRLAVKASRLAGIGTLWAVWRERRREEPYFYEFEPGYFSAEGERKAALEALHLPPDWIFNERDLAGARASSPERTLQAILSLLEYQYGYERKKNSSGWRTVYGPGRRAPAVSRARGKTRLAPVEAGVGARAGGQKRASPIWRRNPLFSVENRA